MRLVVLTRALTFIIGATLFWFVFLTKDEHYLFLGPGVAFAMAAVFTAAPIFTSRLKRKEKADHPDALEVFLLRIACFFAVSMAVPFFPFDVSTGGAWKLGAVALGYVLAFAAPYLLGFAAGGEGGQRSGVVGLALLTLLASPIVLGGFVYLTDHGEESGSFSQAGDYPEPGSPADVYCDTNYTGPSTVMLSNGKRYNKGCLQSYSWKKK